MKQTNEMMSEKVEKDILYSRTVKAGKRVYYIDVKRDRRGALYLSITESKRVKDGNTEERPVFEKHKIFLYSEDVVKFMTALNAATDFTLDHYSASQSKNFSGQQWEKTEDAFSDSERDEGILYKAEENFEEPNNFEHKIKFDIDF